MYGVAQKTGPPLPLLLSKATTNGKLHPGSIEGTSLFTMAIVRGFLRHLIELAIMITDMIFDD